MLTSGGEMSSYQVKPQPHKLPCLEYNILSGASEHNVTKSLSGFHSQSEQNLLNCRRTGESDPNIQPEQKPALLHDEESRVTYLRLLLIVIQAPGLPVPAALASLCRSLILLSNALQILGTFSNSSLWFPTSVFPSPSPSVACWGLESARRE